MNNQRKMRIIMGTCITSLFLLEPQPRLSFSLIGPVLLSISKC